MAKKPRGYTPTPEHRAKIMESLRKAWAASRAGLPCPARPGRYRRTAPPGEALASPRAGRRPGMRRALDRRVIGYLARPIHRRRSGKVRDPLNESPNPAILFILKGNTTVYPKNEPNSSIPSVFSHMTLKNRQEVTNIRVRFVLRRSRSSNCGSRPRRRECVGSQQTAPAHGATRWPLTLGFQNLIMPIGQNAVLLCA
jgi:hypothetical protein